MKLVIIAALVAVCGAAKLDRSYLPPASAGTAGGSSDSLQTPFSRSSANQGAEGLPSGSYTNEFQGVVVDAINPATRVSSGSEQTGLGAPRVSYGSTASKVGDAAFRDSVAGFRQTPSQTGFEGASDGETSGTQISPEFNQGSFVAIPERPQAASDRNANIIRQDSDVGAEAYSYGYETDNGISAVENGVATNGVQAQGGFSYQGDDGQTYSIMYTADEGGYRPVGNHLPTPPPIPEEILKSLEQNAREEAAGIVDDGTYDAQKYNEGGDYPESHNDGQSSQFGNRPESATGSTFINQNQAFGKPTFNTGFSVLGSNVNNRPLSNANAFAHTGLSGQSGNGFGFNQNQPSANTFNQGSDISSQEQDSSDAATSGQFGQSAQASTQTGPFGQAETVAQSSSGPHLSQTPSFGNQDSTGSKFSTQQFSQGSRPQFGAQPSKPQFGQNQIPTSGSAQASSSISGSPAPVVGYQYGGQQGPGPQFGAQPSRPQFGQNQIPTSGSAQASSSISGSPAPVVGYQYGGQQGSGPQFGAQPSRPQFGQNQIPTSGSAQASSSISGSPVPVVGYQYGGQQGSGPQFGAQPSIPQFSQNQIPASGSFAQNSQTQFSSQAELLKPEGAAPDSNSASTFNLGQNTQASGNFLQYSEGRPQGLVSQTNSNRPSSSGQESFNTASNTFGSSLNSASGINGQSNKGTDLAKNNEYLPPLNTNSNGRPTQSSQPLKPEIAPTLSFNQFTTNTQTSNNIPTLSGQDRPQGFQPSGSSSASVGSLPTFSTQSGQFGFQQTQSANNVRPSQFTQNKNNFQSTQGQNQYTSNSNSPQYNSNAQPIQSMSTFTTSSLLATSQPQIELTTPLEPNESSPNNADGLSGPGPSASSFASFGTQPSNTRPSQPQFGGSFQSGLNPSPFATQTTATAFSSLSPTSQPQGQKPFGTPNVQSQLAFPTQASYNPAIKFGDRIPQNKGDTQFASSTQKPSFSLTSQPQSNDDSYYYNQPSKPFGTPNNRPYGSKFPNTAQNQFNNVNSQSSFSQNSFSNNRQPNFPASSSPSRKEKVQGQPGKPSSPTIAPVAPTSATQQETGASQSYYNGITQASISPFGGAPTPSTQFGTQQSSQFGSRPQLPSTQFNQPQTQTQAGISSPSAIQQTFPQRPTNQFGQKPTSFQGQIQSQSESSEDNASQSMPSQQYNGEVYEYNKPEEVLPASEQTDSTSSQNLQSNIQTDSSDNKSQQPEGSKPAFGTRPQVDQNPRPTQGSQNYQEPQGSRPHFGAQPLRPVGAQTQQSAGSKPQYNSPFGKPCCQGNKFSQTSQSTQDTNQFGRPMQGTQTPSQFNVQTTGFQGTQTFKPDPVSQGFERGETFGGPRDPPRFDDKTGYHY